MMRTTTETKSENRTCKRRGLVTITYMNTYGPSGVLVSSHARCSDGWRCQEEHSDCKCVGHAGPGKDYLE